MSMSYNVIGIIEPDEEWQKNKKVWEACVEANIEIPIEVQEYFDLEEPDPYGKKVILNGEEFVTRYLEEPDPENSNSDYPEWGFEVDLEQLPKKFKRIRFCMNH